MGGFAVPSGGTAVVPHTGFEPVISALRGRCPGPLDECGEVEPATSAEPAGMVASAPAGWQPTGLARRRLEAVRFEEGADGVRDLLVALLGQDQAVVRVRPERLVARVKPLRKPF